MVESPASTERTFPPAALPERRVETRRGIGKFAFLAVGLLLLTAATLKLVGLNFSPFAQYGWLLTPTVQTAAVIWEIALGVWLLLNRSRFFAWLAALGTFLSFAVVSGYLGFLGQANCGCFGLIQASPWTAFAVDIAAITLLAFAKPRWLGWGAETVALKWLGGMALVFGLAIGICIVKFGSLDSTVAKLRGEALVATPSVIDFGEGKPGEAKVETITVKNYTDTPYKLVGGTSDCSCLATQDMPIAIPANGQTEIRITLKIPASQPGQMNRTLELFTDCPTQPKLGLKAVCRIGD